MAISDDDKASILRDAEFYRLLRDQLGREQIENARYLKSQLADWYIAITAVCFAIGGIAISVGVGQPEKGIVHPMLFWWGSLLLIFNGILVFFFRKYELEAEDEGVAALKEREADLWSAEKIAREVAENKSGRIDEFEKLRDNITSDYRSRIQPMTLKQWIRFVWLAAFIDTVFGLLVFPVMMLSSQLLPNVRVSFRDYVSTVTVMLVLYIAYVGWGLKKAGDNKRRANRAELRIQDEILK